MKVKNFYKILQKTFPSAYIFVSTNKGNFYLFKSSMALKKFGHYNVIDLEKDYDIYNNAILYYIKV